VATPSEPLPPKKDVMLALLSRSSVFIHLDPRLESVRVPPWFKKQPQLVLQVGLNMAVRIPDLEVQDDAVSCTLSFNRSPFFCYVPWKAVFALVGEDGKGMLWPDDIPKEVAAQQAERAQTAQQKEEARQKVRPVEAVPGPAKEAEPRKPEKAGAEKKQPARKRKVSRTPEEATVAARSSEPQKTTAPRAPESKRQLPPYLRVVK
jgi:stringent starvation protein B